MKSQGNQVNHCLVSKWIFNLLFNISILHLTIILVSPLTGHVIGTGGTQVVDIPVKAGMGCTFQVSFVII